MRSLILEFFVWSTIGRLDILAGGLMGPMGGLAGVLTRWLARGAIGGSMPRRLPPGGILFFVDDLAVPVQALMHHAA